MDQLVQELKLIINARKLNAMYRAKLEQKLQEINTQIYILTHNSQQNSPYPWTKLIDLDDDTSDTFIRLFWGHIGGKLKSNEDDHIQEEESEPEASDNEGNLSINQNMVDEHENENEHENEHENENDNHFQEEEMNIHEMEDPKERKILQMSRVEKRKEFLAYSLTARQRSFLFAHNNPTVSIKSFHHFSICTFDVPYSLYDYVRCIFFTKIFGQNFPFHQVYPHISLKKMKYFLKKILSKETNLDFYTLGIPELTFDFIKSNE